MPPERSHESTDPAGFDYEAALLACASGDSQALRNLYDIEAPQLLGTAMRIVRRRDVAQDVVHDAFVSIWKRAQTFDPARGSGRAWIYTIVRNRALNIVRDERFEHATEPEDLEAMGDLRASTGTEFELLGERSALRRCLEMLDERRRTSVLLAYVEGMSHTQIADRLTVPLGTVKAWIRRSLVALRQCLT